MNKYIVDAWAWIEYFRGTEYGAKLKDILEEPTAEIYTCAISVAEIISKVAREKRDVEAAYDMLLSNSQIVKIDEQLSKQAGLFHSKMRQTTKDFGIADAFILAAAEKLQAKIVTGDPHFEGLKNTILIT
ncbi:MAG: PIN domain-containing protein [Candidatus Bathyarchaeota archaeon]|nr:PIN domain-containing protein [Candidatus Bathyarchaeota archaeon]